MKISIRAILPIALFVAALAVGFARSEASGSPWAAAYSPTKIEWLALKAQATLHSESDKMTIAFQEGDAVDVIRMNVNLFNGGPGDETIRGLVGVNLDRLRDYSADLKVPPPIVKLRIVNALYECRLPPMSSDPPKINVATACKVVGDAFKGSRTR